MDHVTQQRAAEFERQAMIDGLTLDERIERARKAAQDRAPAITEPTLELEPEEPELVQLTRQQLHDLVVAGAGSYLRELAGLRGDKARTHAVRVAERVADVLDGHPEYLHHTDELRTLAGDAIRP